MSGIQFAQYPWRQFRVPFTGLNLDNASAGGFTRCVNFDYQGGKMVTRKGFFRAGSYGSYITVSASNDGILSIYQYDSTAGKLILLTYDGKVSKLTGGSDPLDFTGVVELKTGYTVNSYWKWGTLNNWAVAVCNDASFITDGTNVRTLGVSWPSAAPSLAGSGSGTGLVAGTYRVSYSYVRSGTYGYESMKSPTGEVVITAGQQIDVTVVASTNAQIDKINIFCTGPGGTVEYYQQQENNSSTTYNITSIVTTPTSGYGNNGIAPDDFGLPPQAADFLSIVGNRAWYGVAGSSIVWRSHENQPETCSLMGFDYFGRNDGLDITGIGVIGDMLVVLKPTKIFIQDIWSFAITVFTEAKGTIAPHSVQSVLIKGVRGLIFLSNRYAIEIFTGNKIYSLTDEVITEFIGSIIDITNIDKVRSAYHVGLSRYTIVIPVKGGGYREFNCFLEGGDFSMWSEYSKPYPGAMCVVTDSSEKFKLITSYMNESVAYIYIHDEGGTDDNEDIRFSLKTGFTDCGLAGIQKTFRRIFLDGILFGYEQSGAEDSDLWGYLFTSRKNDKIITSPFDVGVAAASSEQSGYEKEKAFDNDLNTQWRSAEGEDNGLRVGARVKVIDSLLGSIGGPVIYVKEYSPQYVTWKWDDVPKSYVLRSFKIIPSAGGVKNFLVRGRTEESQEWIDLFEGVCNYDLPSSYGLPSSDVAYDRVALWVNTVYDGSVARVKEFNVVALSDVDLSGYIFSKDPGTIIRKVWFDYYSEMNDFISTWKTNNVSWSTYYNSAEVTFDINDNQSIADALGFLNKADLDAAVMEKILSDRLLEYNVGNNIFVGFPSGTEVVLAMGLYADENVVPYAERSIAIPAVRNYLVDDRMIIERTQVDVFGKMETFSFEIEWTSEYGLIINGLDVWFAPQSFPPGGEDD